MESTTFKVKRNMCKHYRWGREEDYEGQLKLRCCDCGMWNGEEGKLAHEYLPEDMILSDTGL